MKKHLLLVLSVMIAGNLAACGRMYSGNYQGSVQETNGVQQCAGAATLTLNQNGNTLQGTLQSTTNCGSVQLQIVGGSINGDTITGVTATGSGGCQYTNGNLSVKGGGNFVISGQFVPAVSPMICPQIILINASKE